MCGMQQGLLQVDKDVNHLKSDLNKKHLCQLQHKDRGGGVDLS